MKQYSDGRNTPQRGAPMSKEMSRQIWSLLYVIGFFLMLFAPVLSMNKVSGKISETENRQLADFPEVFDEEGNFADGFKSGFESWLGDNLGFRSEFVGLATNIKLKILHQSTSEKVEIGRDGWYFYTLDHNIELASGEFTLSEETLRDIAKKQQRISDWYASQGIPYILVLTPSKAAIYPEFIASGDYGIRTTPCDQLEQYLTEHTTVTVVNTKSALLENKQAGQLFLKTDTHWTSLGSYIAYQAIEEKLRSIGIATKSFPISFTEGKQKGEFSAMLGYTGLFAEETVPVAEWDRITTDVNSGSLFDRLMQLRETGPTAKVIGYTFIENRDAKNGTLLIYSDSQWEPIRKLPLYLGESFQTVAAFPFRSINLEYDNAVRPDVVIFGCSERLIDNILTRTVNVPNVRSSLPELPSRDMISREEYGEWIANQGICLDLYNGIAAGGGTTIPIASGANSVELRGWGADFRNVAPFRELYLQVGDSLFQCDYNIDRTNIVEYFGKDSLLKTGFQVTFPANYLQDGAVTEVSFIGVSADGAYLYTPVTYQLAYS